MTRREQLIAARALAAQAGASARALEEALKSPERHDAVINAAHATITNARTAILVFYSDWLNDRGAVQDDDEIKRRLLASIEDAERAEQEDGERWEELQCAQDTEEAEESGRLAGYVEGLRAALAMLS